MIQVVILAGGLGTRLGNLTSNRPKCLVEISGVPFLDIQLRLLESKACSKVLLCIGHLGDMVISHIQSRNYEPLKIDYVIDKEPNIGTLGALLNAQDYLDDEFIVTYGDSYLETDYQAIFREFKNLNCDVLMTYCEFVGSGDVPNVQKRSDTFIRYQKNKTANSDYTYTDFGLLMLRKRALESLSIYGNDLALALEKSSEKGSIRGHEVAGRYYEIGNVVGISELENYLKGKQNDLHR